MKDKQIRQIFTFGYNHPERNKYVIIYGSSKEECREKMFKRFGQKWSRQYDSEKEAGVKEFNLKLL